MEVTPDYSDLWYKDWYCEKIIAETGKVPDFVPL